MCFKDCYRVLSTIVKLSSPLMSAFCIKVMTLPWMWLFMKNPFEGAQCAVYLATDKQLKNISGEYFK